MAVLPGGGEVGLGGMSVDERYVQLVSEHSASLLRLAVLLATNRQDAEDAVQESLIALARAWPRVRSSTALAYARKIVVREVIRTYPTGKEVLVEHLPERGVEDLGFLREEEDRAFMEHVQRLPDRQRAVIVLRYYDQLSDRQIAGLLSCSQATVRSQAHHALETLRRQNSAIEEK